MNGLSRSVVEKQKEILKISRLQSQALLGQNVTARFSSNLMFNVILNCAYGNHCCTHNFAQNSCPREQKVFPDVQVLCILL